MTQNRPALLAAVLFSLLVCFGIWLRPLFPIDETRYISVAWEMYLSGDYFVPTKNGAVYSHKPPLLFWLINLVWSVFGVSEFAARLVAPAFSVLNIYLTYRLGRMLFPDAPQIARNGAVLLCSLVAYTIYTSLTMFDAMLTTATLLGLMGIWRGISDGTLWGWLIFGAALGLGVLTKGPVIFLHILPALVAYKLWAQSPKPQGRLRFRGIALGFAIGLGIVLLWLLPAIILGGEVYRNEILWKQSAGRVANVFDHARPPWFFLMLLPVYLFPWVLNLNVWHGLGRVLRQAEIRFLLISAVSAFVLFSLVGSKQAHYLVPEMPLVALIVAAALAQVKWRRALDVTLPLMALICAVVAGSILIAPNSLIPVSDLPGTPFGVAMVLLVLALGAAFAWWQASVFSTTVWSLLLVAAVNLGVANTPILPRYQLDGFIAAFEGREGQDIAYFGHPYHAEFNFLARLETPIYLPVDQADLTRWAAEHPGGVVVACEGCLTQDAAPQQVIRYRSDRFGVWTADALK